MLGMRN